MNGKLTGLRFLLTGGSFLQIAVYEVEATQIIDGWKQGSLKPRIGGSNQLGSWAIEVDKIIGVHTAPLAEPTQPYPATLQSPWRGSGLTT